MAIHIRTKADSKIIILVAYYIIVTVYIKISYSLLCFWMSSCAIAHSVLVFCNAWAIGWLTVAVPPANQIRAPFRLQLLEAQLRNPSTESRERGLSAPSSHFPEMGLNGQYGFPLFQKGSYTWFPHLSMDYDKLQMILIWRIEKKEDKILDVIPLTFWTFFSSAWNPSLS